MIKKYALIGIVLLAVFLNFTGLTPNVRHPDEPPIHDYAKNLIVNIVSKGDFDPHSFKYGSTIYFIHGFFYFIYLSINYVLYSTNTLLSSSFISKPIPIANYFAGSIHIFETQLQWLGRAVTALFGVGNVLLTYFIARKLFGKKIALLSSLFITIAPLEVRDAHYITTDIPALFFMLLSIYFLLFLIEKGSLKSYVFSGFFIGLAATIRYFPIVILAYPVAVVLGIKKNNQWFWKSIIGGIFILVGVVIGIPFLFINKNGPALFVKDMQDFVLPWYSTSLSNYVFSLASFIFSRGKTILPDIKTALPENFRPYLASYVIFKGFGVIPAILGIVGTIFILLKEFRKGLILFVLPFALLVYASFYLHVMYERIMIPILPFLAISAAYFILWIYKRTKALVVLIFLVIISLIIPLIKSSVASVSCGQTSIYDMSEAFIAQNIDPNSSVAFLPPVSFPSDPKFGKLKLIELFPYSNFSLEEVRNIGGKYAFINGSRLEYENYMFFNDFFITPEPIYKNSYLYLTQLEYEERAKILGKLTKYQMCERSRVYYYELPDEIKVLPSLLLDKINLNWSSERFDVSGKVVNNNSVENIGNLLVYNPTKLDYIPPRVVSQKIAIEANKTYSFSVSLKADMKKKNDSHIFLRMDYYRNDEKTNTYGNLQKLAYFIYDGTSPFYFEKEMTYGLTRTDPTQPGRYLYLSPRATPDESWQKVSVVSRAPTDADYLLLSIQADTSFGDPIYFDKISLTTTQ